MTKKKRKKPGRPPVRIEEARAFGRLVEREQKPGDIQARVFERVRRTDPRRWGSERKMYRLWRMYQNDKVKVIEEVPSRWVPVEWMRRWLREFYPN